MIKTVGLIPSVIERRNSNHLMVDYKLISFIEKCFPKHQIKILTGTEKKIRLDYIISIGSNDILKIKNTNSNKLRKKLDDYYFTYSLKKNIPFTGICYGAQYIAKFFKSKIVKKKNHTKKNHKIFFNRSDKTQNVNSYHDYSIIKLGKKLKTIAYTKDGSIEAFIHKKKRILGIMWHPERYNQIRKFDIKFIKKYT